jgi:hypothetical protein
LRQHLERALLRYRFRRSRQQSGAYLTLHRQEHWPSS